MSRMGDVTLKILEAEMLYVDSHSSYPAAYDAEVDPDPRIKERELQIERLHRQFLRWGDHRWDCQTRTLDTPRAGCSCGFRQALDGTLWDSRQDADLDKALAWFSDDADAERKKKADEADRLSCTIEAMGL